MCRAPAILPAHWIGSQVSPNEGPTGGGTRLSHQREIQTANNLFTIFIRLNSFVPGCVCASYSSVGKSVPPGDEVSVRGSNIPASALKDSLGRCSKISIESFNILVAELPNVIALQRVYLDPSIHSFASVLDKSPKNLMFLIREGNEDLLDRHLKDGYARDHREANILGFKQGIQLKCP